MQKVFYITDLYWVFKLQNSRKDENRKSWILVFLNACANNQPFYFRPFSLPVDLSTSTTHTCIHSYTKLKAIHIDLIWSDERPKWWESVEWNSVIDPHQKMENDDVNGYQRLPTGGLFWPLGVQPLVIFSHYFWTI